jgi:glycosyltransferase involved in cell wall biosynthesis
VSDTDISNPEAGNPGIGGTQFLTVCLPYYFNKHVGDSVEPVIYANVPQHLPESVQSSKSSTASDALKQAAADGIRFFIWRPTENAEGQDFVAEIDNHDVDIICWMHNLTSAGWLHHLDSIENVAAFVFVGREQLDLIRDCRVFNSSTYIFNGFDTRRYRPEIVHTDDQTVTYLGSLIPSKGFHILAELWPEIVHRVPGAHLRVIGTGNLYDREKVMGQWNIADESYEQQFRPPLSNVNGRPRDSVSFEGLVSSDRKIELLQDAAVGIVNPSGRTANCPGSALEFQAAGTPVVSVAHRGLLDVVQHNNTGLLGKDRSEIREHIITLLRDEQQRAVMGQAGIEFVESRFNYQDICEQWLTLFGRLTDGESPMQPEVINKYHNYKYVREVSRLVRRNVSGGYRVPCMRRAKELVSSVIR